MFVFLNVSDAGLQLHETQRPAAWLHVPCGSPWWKDCCGGFLLKNSQKSHQRIQIVSTFHPRFTFSILGQMFDENQHAAGLSMWTEGQGWGLALLSLWGLSLTEFVPQPPNMTPDPDPVPTGTEPPWCPVKTLLVRFCDWSHWPAVVTFPPVDGRLSGNHSSWFLTTSNFISVDSSAMISGPQMAWNDTATLITAFTCFMAGIQVWDDV